MTAKEVWAVGIDLGGTKIEVAQVDGSGRLVQRLRRPTNVKDGPFAIRAGIAAAVRDLQKNAASSPIGVGVGVAGQVDTKLGIVRFAPNLGWQGVPFQADLSQALGLPVVITNDVRAATWGEWLHGAGKGCDDLVCLFVGTGIGGGVVSRGEIISGCSNTAGEVGHITIDLNGPPCHCGNRGCLEALAGGWAIAQQAQEAIARDPMEGAHLLRMVDGKPGAITAKIVAQADREGDPLARRILDRVAQALIAGAVSLVNAFNPCRLIMGGGVIEGMPELIDRISQGVQQQALSAATLTLQVLPAQLKNDAGVIGAATLAIRHFMSKEEPRE